MNNIWSYLSDAYRNGALPILGKGIPAFQIRKRFTTAQVNAGGAGAIIVAAPGAGFKLRMINAKMIAVGGAATSSTTIDILGTLTTSRKLLAVAVAVLTQSAVVRDGAASATVLADGASYTVNDANTAITIGVTGSALTVATAIDVDLVYSVELSGAYV